ncbi:hypothetical protein DVH24_015716 [Malus domestica]|uniref:Uncharacterized protein n=1 Tax=Malus domestica TaxID=3750 RepID=A0A498HLB8_MALDO|nr:hypothetical protein DVH24_015716 [Malus domestica]
MTEYDDRLREVERYKMKLQESKQLVDNARKTSKALTEAVQLRDQTLEMLKRRNGENLRLKKQLEATILKASKAKWEAFHHVIRPYCAQEIQLKKKKWMTILERYDGGGIIKKYRAEMKEHRQKGEPFVLELNPSSGDESEDDTSANEQTQQGEDGLEDAEDGGDNDVGETQHDNVESSTSEEDDS